MNPINIIKQLQQTSSRLEKESILREAWNNGCHEFFRGAVMAYDPLLTFGIKQVPSILEDGDDETNFTWIDFYELASKLSSRELTGNAAINAIEEAAYKSDMDEWMLWYRPILLKDLRAGITSKTINKVLKSTNDIVAEQFIIKLFECQLAEDYEKHPNKLIGKKRLDVKINGVRLLTILDKENHSVKQYTREGRENDNFPHLIEGLTPLLDLLPGSIVLDGEVTGFDFRDLMSQLNRKYNTNTKSAKLALFDIIPLSDFRNGLCDIIQRERDDALIALEGPLYEHTSGNVYILPKKEVDLDTTEGKDILKEFNKFVLSQNYEGIMIKDPEAVYKCDRNTAWLKMKPFITLDLIIKDIEEGTKKNAGRMGNFICVGEHEGKNIEVSVGSGFTDMERNEFWISKDTLIGRMVEIEADEISQNKKGHYSLRFPRFVKFRDLGPGTDKI